MRERKKLGSLLPWEKNAVDYLKRLEEPQWAYGLRSQELLSALPELLNGWASLWAGYNHFSWHTWEDFLVALRGRFFPSTFDEDLDNMIWTRKQREGEMVAEYTEELRTLLQWRGGYSPSTELRQLCKNLRPEYKLYIRPSDCGSVEEIKKAGRAYEAIRAEKRWVKSEKGSAAYMVASISDSHFPSLPSSYSPQQALLLFGVTYPPLLSLGPAGDFFVRSSYP